MFDSVEQIRDQLVAGEDAHAEFTSVRLDGQRVRGPNADEVAGELVAFANATGGALFLGVADDGTPEGIPPDQLRTVEAWLADIASHNCDPPLRPVLRRVPLPGPDGEVRTIVLAECPEGLFVHRTAGGRWFSRVGSTKRDLTQPELSRLFSSRGRTFVFDETAVPDATTDDLDADALARDLALPARIATEQLLRNRHICSDEPAHLGRPTVAGLLCFGKHPQDHLPGAGISAAVYRGTRRDSDELVHAQRIDGPLARQIDEAVAFVDRFMLRPARRPVGREDHPQFALGAVHEAVVNAVAHRDYAIAGSRIRLFVYADRLEVISPGGLPNTVTIETMAYRQFSRNQLIVALLARLHSPATGRRYIEERGEGVTRILEDSLAHAGRAPEYHLHGPELHLTIWGRPSPHGT